MLESEYFGASRRGRPKHRRKAITGIVTGLVLTVGAAIGGYYTFEAGKGRDFFVLIMLPGLAFSIWGCGHLARHRGYPTYSAYLLFGLGLTVIGCLIGALPGTLEAKTAGFVFVFGTLLPAVVILALPVKKDHRVHRRHKREPTGF